MRNILIRYSMLLLAMTMQLSVHAQAKGTADIKSRAIRVGVMLPLHDVDGDGRRMVEYYRGILMAADDLKREGISLDIHAWNVNIDADIRQTLLQEGADKMDIIFGPLYTKQVAPLGEFAKAYNIKVVIPFSINGNDVEKNPQIYQVYQTPETLNAKAVNAFLDRFGGYHPVFIDCNDPESRKGVFTQGLRQQLDKKGIKYNITNLNSPYENFVKAFSLQEPNVVILNTGRSPELTAAYRKLDELTRNNSALRISMFGYTEWLMYERTNLAKFNQYDTYIPSYFYFNVSSQKTQTLLQGYNRWFHAPMMEANPRFAITGYDHACFFLRGLHLQGNKFNAGTADKNAVQTPLRFERASKKGGMKNNMFMLVHYNRDRSISLVNY